MKVYSLEARSMNQKPEFNDFHWILPRITFIFAISFALLVSELAFSAPPKDAPQITKVILHEAKWTEDFYNVLVPAKVDAKIQSVVTAPIEAHVVQLKKQLGSRVHAGEAIVFLENQDPGFTYAKVPIRAPFSGILSQTFVSEMTHVLRGDKLFTIVDDSAVKILSEVASTDVHRLKVGALGKFQSDGLEFKVTLSGLSPLIDPRTGTASAEFILTKGQKQKPAIGSLGQISMQIPAGSILAVPETAVFINDSKPHVRVMTAENKTKKIPIEIQETRGDQIVVKSGISKGEKIVVRSSRPIKEDEVVETN